MISLYMAPLICGIPYVGDPVHWPPMVWLKFQSARMLDFQSAQRLDFSRFHAGIMIIRHRALWAPSACSQSLGAAGAFEG